MSFGLIVLLVVVGTTIWVGFDASRREWPEGKTGTGGWVIGCVLLWIVIFPIYLSRRNRAPLKDGATGGSAAPAQAAMHRECPLCKEWMRRDASVCPHCRNESPAWTLHEGRWWFRAAEGWQWFDESSGAWVPHEPPIDPAGAV
ncbi:MAG TPA: hypothetical protein VNC40_00035 [Gaiellaceae bacterium]|nr:hypothetical protein [Gaiellaceae bacterium]